MYFEDKNMVIGEPKLSKDLNPLDGKDYDAGTQHQLIYMLINKNVITGSIYYNIHQFYVLFFITTDASDIAATEPPPKLREKEASYPRISLRIEKLIGPLIIMRGGQMTNRFLGGAKKGSARSKQQGNCNK